MEFSEMVDCGVSEGYLRKAKSTGTKCWEFMDDPADNRKVLIGYDSLKDKYKEMVQRRYGNPYEAMAKEPIRRQVVTDHKAEEYFLTYKHEGGTSLPMEHVKKYAKAAAWLNMLNRLNADKKYIKKELKLTLDKFYMHVCELIKIDRVDLPTSYQRLRNKMADYDEKGYSSLIDWRFGNNLAAKVNDDLSESMLIELISHSNQHDDTIIARAYNNWAAENGYKTIDAATVGVHRRKNLFQVQPYRNGNSTWYNSFGKHIHRKRPSAPLLLVGSDDNDLDLYFIEEKLNAKGHNHINYYYRYKLIVVMDAHNDYILGYAYGDQVTADLVKAAFLDAMHHVKELTGGWYLPHQLQTDQWGRGTLDTFYKSIATYTPATAKVARAKYIEQAFGQTWHQSLKLYPNYAGHNITSGSRINSDALDINKKNFPRKDKAHQYIYDHVNRLRMLVDEKTGKSRQQVWVENFAASEMAQEKQISDKRMLLLFGTPHNYSNTLTNGGLEVTINGALRTYDIPDDLYLENVGKKVQVIYDQFDLSRVLVTDNRSLHFVAQEFAAMPSAIADYQPGDRARLNYLLAQKKNHVQTIAGKKEARLATLERHNMDAESLLQANVMVKEIKQAAELTYSESRNGKGYDPLDQM
jgi:hypothetical protein